jgi:hypothetical protein
MKLGDTMRIVNKTYQVYTFEELDESIKEKLIIHFDNYDPNWYDHIMDDYQDHSGFAAKVVGFDLDRKDLEVKELSADLSTLRDAYATKYFSKSMTKKEYKAFSSELRLISYLYVASVRLYRDDSTVEISDEFSCFYENMKVDHNRLEAFFEDTYTDFKHLVIKDLQDAYDWNYAEERVIEDLQENEYLEDGSTFYE